MPSTFSIDPDADLVRCHLDGDPPPDRAAERLDAVLASPQFRHGLGFLDVRRRGQDLTAAHIQGLAALIRSRAGRLAPCRWAVVAGCEEDFPAVRVLALLTEKTGVKVIGFTDLTRAEQWARAGGNS
jgi:hypothetical protein